MNKFRILFPLAILLLIASLITSCYPSNIDNTANKIKDLSNRISNLENLPTYQTATVTRIVDGDTIVVNIDGVEYKVRYIGIDTPETVDPRKPVQFMGKEASAKNKELVEGKTVRLEKDVSDTDRYGRLLRYVWIKPADDWADYLIMVNAELIRQGFAQVATYPPDVKYQTLFLELQRQAKEDKLGLWQ